MEVGTAGNGLAGTLCAAAAPCFPLEPFQEAWLFSWGAEGKTRSQEVIKSHYCYLLLVNISAVVMWGGASQVLAVSASRSLSLRGLSVVEQQEHAAFGSLLFPLTLHGLLLCKSSF